MINSRSLNDLYPYVKEQFEKANSELKKQGIEVLVVSTLRDQEYQTKLYNQGRTTKGNIVTNAKLIGPHGYGLALDVVPMVDGKCAWDRTDLYNKIAVTMKKYGFTWGGDWKSISDKPHFEMTQGLSSADLRNGKFPKFNQTTDLSKGIDWLVSHKIISSGDYWLKVAEGKAEFNAEWFKLMIERIGKL